MAHNDSNERFALFTDDESLDPPEIHQSMEEWSFDYNHFFKQVIKMMYFVVAVFAFYLLAKIAIKNPAQEWSDEKVQRMVQEELLKSTHLANEGLQKLFESTLSEQLPAKCREMCAGDLRSPDVVLERNVCSSKLDLDLTFLNDAIRTELKKLIREKNLDENGKPDYASELNNAIVLAASNTFVGKKDRNCYFIGF